MSGWIDVVTFTSTAAGGGFVTSFFAWLRNREQNKALREARRERDTNVAILTLQDEIGKQDNAYEALKAENQKFRDRYHNLAQDTQALRFENVALKARINELLKERGENPDFDISS